MRLILAVSATHLETQYVFLLSLLFITPLSFLYTQRDNRVWSALTAS